MAQSNVSADLIWELTRANNAFLVKRAASGGVQFSRDPLNLTNKNSRKYAGYVNDKAVGIESSQKGGAVMTTKTTKHHNKPAAHLSSVSLSGEKSGPKSYKTVASYTAKQGYRPDLLPEAVARASRIRQCSKPQKEFEVKPRGAKASNQ